MTPRIFISSTIYDFADLRSALKYYLENLGYEVQLSEFNDFDKDSAKNSYDACLDAIRRCNYFILLIGSRKGGMYDNDVSITQKEYETAYDLAKEEKIRIINFVRRPVWDIKQDRNDLKKYLAQDFQLKYNFSNEDFAHIINHEGTIIKDTEFIFDFIDEISRKGEMKVAVKSGKDYPKSNWVHLFNNYKDIIDVLSVEYNLKYDLQTKTLLEYFGKELLKNYQLLNYSRKSKSLPIYQHGIFLESLDFTQNVITLDENLSKQFMFYLITAFRSYNLEYEYLKLVINSGHFLKTDVIFDFDKNIVINDGLLNLKKQIFEIKSFEKILSTEYRTKHLDAVEKHLKANQNLNIGNFELLPYKIIFGYIYNTYLLIKGLYRAIFQNDIAFLEELQLIDTNPHKKEIEEENVSIDDIMKMLKKN